MKPPALLRSAFAANLRWLCNTQHSIASVCRETGINRQQFNRYLAGTAIPSAQVMRVICAKFGVAEASMFLPQKELIQLVGLNRSTDELTKLLGVMGARKPDKLKPGFYFRYELATGEDEGLWLRSLYVVRENDGGLRYRATRKANGMGRDRLTGTILKISNFVYFFETRLPATEELSFAVFGHAPGGKLRSGMVFHQQRATRAALEYVGETVNVRQLLKRCGSIAPDAAGLDQNLRALLLPANESVGVPA